MVMTPVGALPLALLNWSEKGSLPQFPLNQMLVGPSDALGVLAVCVTLAVGVHVASWQLNTEFRRRQRDDELSGRVLMFELLGLGLVLLSVVSGWCGALGPGRTLGQRGLLLGCAFACASLCADVALLPSKARNRITKARRKRQGRAAQFWLDGRPEQGGCRSVALQSLFVGVAVGTLSVLIAGWSHMHGVKVAALLVLAGLSAALWLWLLTQFLIGIPGRDFTTLAMVVSIGAVYLASTLVVLLTSLTRPDRLAFALGTTMALYGSLPVWWTQVHPGLRRTLWRTEWLRPSLSIYVGSTLAHAARPRRTKVHARRHTRIPAWWVSAAGSFAEANGRR